MILYTQKLLHMRRFHPFGVDQRPSPSAQLQTEVNFRQDASPQKLDQADFGRSDEVQESVLLSVAAADCRAFLGKTPQSEL